jgi:hypothetical protein
MKKGLGLAIVSIYLFMISASGDMKNPGQNMAYPLNIQARADFGRMPLYFTANRGQIDERVAFYIQGLDRILYFTADGLTISLVGPGKSGEEREGREQKTRRSGAFSVENAENRQQAVKKAEIPEDEPSTRWVVKLDFVGANSDVKPIGTEKTEAVISYFKGKPEDWKTGLPTYSKIVYPDLWPGIDLVYFGTVNRLKYEFIVHPGADPTRIRLAYRGASRVGVNDEGKLEVMTPAGALVDDLPVAFQDIDERRINIPVTYRMDNDDTSVTPDQDNPGSSWTTKRIDPQESTGERASYGFDIGDYDRTQILVLDPAVLVYCGYIGGNSWDNGYGIAVDGQGNGYITGPTAGSEATFPVTVGPDLSWNGSIDAFVAKVNAAGTALLYCGFIGGDQADYGYGIDVDDSGCAYVTGNTISTQATFPVVVGPILAQNDGEPGSYPDAFVAKVSASGNSLLYCGYVGGKYEDKGYAIAVDGAGSAYITGFTTSDETTFPAVGGPDLSYNGAADIFVAKVNPEGSGFVYRGYIGGSGSEYGYGIAVDASGNAYVTGTAYSGDFPVTVGPDLTFNGLNDAFVAKISPSGTSLFYCGYIGGSGSEDAYGIAVDGAGSAYVTGYTDSTEASFPVTVGPDLSSNGAYDAFVAKVNASGSSLAYCGYVGGAAIDYGYGIAVDHDGNAYIAGETASSEGTFPATRGPDLTYNGNRDAFVAKLLNGGISFEYCGYIGGTDWEYGQAIAVDDAGDAYVTGMTKSSTAMGFPVAGGPDLSQNGFEDAFVAKISASKPQLAIFDGHDYDGNGTSDISVYRPSDGGWYISGQSDTQWGTAGDIPVPGNYDLDAATEIAIFRPSGGFWYISGISTSQWGASGDIPVPQDYNGGGVTDLAVWRPSNGVWYINGVGDVQWGQEGDLLVPGDYDGDGVDEVAVWRPTSGEWFIYGGGHFQWGAEGDIPIPADYNGDGTTDIAVYRPSIGMWYIQYSGGGTAAIHWGIATDIPVPGDYDGNGTTDLAIWRPTDGLWHIYGGATTQYGQMGDIPLVR